MKIHTLFLIGCFLLIDEALCQQVVSSAGNHADMSGYSVSWTTGEVVTQTMESASTKLTQGFQQPTFTLIGLNERSMPDNVSIYPNPFSNKLFINLAESTIMSPEVWLTDATGKIVLQQKLHSGHTTTIDFPELGQGSYLFNIKASNQLYSFTLIKTN